MNTTSDVSVNDHGSVIGLTPMSEAADAWFSENVAAEPWQCWGPTVWVDHRFADAIIEGLREEGFSVS